MIEGRCETKEGSSQLKKARLHLHCLAREGEEKEEGLIERLQKCRDNGLDVKWQL
jgi:hypothetical protein